jgi:hypothetical protein
VVPARSLGAGVYEADVTVSRFITYYVFVGSVSEKLKYNELPYFSLMAIKPQAKAEGSS